MQQPGDSYEVHNSIKAALMTSIVPAQNVMDEFTAISDRSDQVKFVSKFMDGHGFLDHSNQILKIPKNDETSDKCRNEGNQFYVKSEYIDAVAKYNESLCYAESKVNLALAYANRSAVCFELQMYSTCLQNIELAKSHGYPVEKMARLDERAEKCHRLIVEGAETDENMLKPSGEEFLKLNHPPHPKLPYIADCLDVKFNDEFGRFVITKKRLLPGEIVCIEAPFSKWLHSTHKYKHCTNCIENSFLSLIPCPLSTSVMFCSQKCQDNANASYHEIKNDVIDGVQRICPEAYLHAIDIFFKSLKACNGNLEKLKTVIEENENNAGMTILDVDDPSNPVDVLRAIDSLETHESKSNLMMKFLCCGTVALIVDLFLKHTKLTEILKTENEKDFFRSFLLKHAQISFINFHSFGDSAMKMEDLLSCTPVCGGSFPFLSLINHSCAANVSRFSDNRNIYLMIEKVIQPGEQLFDNYYKHFDSVDITTRRDFLRLKYMFDCKCEACVKKFPLISLLPTKLTDINNTMMMLQNIVQMQKHDAEIAKKLFKKFKDFIVKNMSLYPCKELIDVQINLHRCYMIFVASKLSLHLFKWNSVDYRNFNKF